MPNHAEPAPQSGMHRAIGPTAHRRRYPSNTTRATPITTAAR